jgi:uncharacterized membrane protein YbhN (UPF0104 family)
MNKFKKNLKLFIFIICIGFMAYKFSESYSDIVSRVQLSIFEIFLLLFCVIIFFNLINLRAFLLIKSSIGYAYSYSDWSKLYFESSIVNSFILFTGTVYKAIQLKKRDVNYTKFIATSYLLFSSYISISLIFVSLELLFIKKIFPVAYIFLVTILVFFLFFGPTILENLIRLFFKFKILSKYTGSTLKLFEILKKFFSKKKTIIILCFNTIIVHIFEIGIFYLAFTIFLDNANVETIIILFAVNLIVDRIPFFSGIPGVSEIVLGTTGVLLGIIFTDVAIIKLSLRLLNYLSILLNSGAYFVISYFDKNKFVEV